MSWQTFLILAGAHFLALLSPGPDFFLLLNHSLAHGQRAGFQTALGIACANGVFMLSALFGLRILEESHLAFAVMYWSGCGYLAWLGWQFWRAKPAPILAASPSTSLTHPAFFVRGFASGILNPKNAMFYLTLFTVLAGKNSTTLARSLAGLWMFLAVLGWDCWVSWLFSRPRILATFSRQQIILHRGSACILFCIAGGMAWTTLIG